MNCSNCGQQIDNRQNFCSSCGHSLTKNHLNENKGEVEGRQRKMEKENTIGKESTAIFIAAAISLVLALIWSQIGLNNDIEYAKGYIPSYADLSQYIQKNKEAHSKELFIYAFVCSFLIIVIGRYIFKFTK